MRAHFLFSCAAILAFAHGAAGQDETAVTEIGCSVVTAQDDADDAFDSAPTIQVMESTADDAFELALDEGVAALVCDRSSAVPAASDHKVPDAGYPLYLRAITDDAMVVTALTRADDGYSFRVVEGDLTAEDIARANARLAAFVAMPAN